MKSIRPFFSFSFWFSSSFSILSFFLLIILILPGNRPCNNDRLSVASYNLISAAQIAINDRPKARGIDHIDWVVSTVGIQVLCPRLGCGALVAILGEEAAGVGVVVAGVHVLQAGGLVLHAAGEGGLVEEILLTLVDGLAEGVVVVTLDQGTVGLDDGGDAAPDVVVVEEVFTGVGVQGLVGIGEFKALAGKDGPIGVEDVLSQQASVFGVYGVEQGGASVLVLGGAGLLHALSGVGTGEALAGGVVGAGGCYLEDAVLLDGDLLQLIHHVVDEVLLEG